MSNCKPSNLSPTICPRAVSFRLLTALTLFSLVIASNAKGQTNRTAPRPNVRSTTTVPPSPTAKTERDSIWASDSDPNAKGDAYFRRVMDLPTVEFAHVEFESSESCEVFLNGLRVGATKSPGVREKVDVLATVRPGKNILSIRATNRSKKQPSISVGFYFKPTNQKWRIVVSDSEWLATSRVNQGWQLLRYDDTNWPAASTAGSAPSSPQFASLNDGRIRSQLASKTEEGLQDNEMGDDVKLTPKTGAIKASIADYNAEKGLPPPERFTTRPGFRVREVFSNSEVGSLVAMTFNEFGHIIASQEGGPLLLLYDSDKDGTYDKSRVYCELVKNIQGILSLNGDVYVTGDGDQGSGLYRLVDSDRNGELEKSELLIQFKGIPGEHGPHQLTFGPDGSIYLVVGNHSQVVGPWSTDSTYPKPYEGDLVQPRQEDPGGHAEGVKAPGGTVLRYELTSKKISVIAGGLRNVYDLAFHPNGTLYVHDSDMEADIGAVWHRSTSLFRIVEGGEYGWRSGWANWPEYYLDRLPALATSGRGSPTGMAFYNHFKYPTKYNRSLFLADWSEGRILSFNVEGSEASKPRMEEFVVGTPMNVTDLEVGPDGNLYFSTGGRSTDGGIFRVEFTGDVPKQVSNLGEGITKAIRLPQIASAFGRQAAALTKKEIGDEWADLVSGVAFSDDNPAKYRIQALDLMQMLGPVPTAEMLLELSNTSSEHVRAKCARLLGLHPESAVAERLVALLNDPSPTVRSAACESMVRLGVICDPAAVQKLLQSDIREERFLARRVLSQIPDAKWKDDFLSSSSNRLVINSALVLVTQSPTPYNAELALQSLKRVSDGFVGDADFVDLLRVMQVAMHLATVDANTAQEMRSLITKEFPAGNATINAELIRIAAFLQCDVVPAAIKYLQTDTSMPERVLIAMHLPNIQHEWTSKERMGLLQFLESAQKVDGGGSYQLYVMRTSHALSEFLTEEESLKILTLGEQYPNAALAALLKLPEQLDSETIARLTQLDSKIDKGGLEEDVFKRLKTGITAILSAQDDDSALEYLRQRWRKSPDRRATIALALSQKPSEDNWDYLVRSMGVVETFAVPDLCAALKQIDVATDDPDAIRQTIIQGCKLSESGQSAKPVLDLLEYWTGENPVQRDPGSTSPLASWQNWFEVRYPDKPPATLPGESERPRWSLDFLEQFLSGDQGKYGSAQNGSILFAKAQCASCHKMNSKGNGFGPDLSSVAKRFTKTEFLESTLYPSHVISDQYASKKVLTVTGEVHTGIVIKTSKGISVRVNQEKEVAIEESEIDEILPSRVSAMPSGLLDNLTPTEIRDLLCFFGYIPQENIAQEKSPIRR